MTLVRTVRKDHIALCLRLTCPSTSSVFVLSPRALSVWSSKLADSDGDFVPGSHSDPTPGILLFTQSSYSSWDGPGPEQVWWIQRNSQDHWQLHQQSRVVVARDLHFPVYRPELSVTLLERQDIHNNTYILLYAHCTMWWHCHCMELRDCAQTKVIQGKVRCADRNYEHFLGFGLFEK